MLEIRFNPYHAAAGSAAGGQFAPASGGGGKKPPAKGQKPPAKDAKPPANGHKPPAKGTRPATNQHPVALGETGKRVSDLQSRLNALGAKPPLKADGIFGPKTLAAVRAFQRAHGLKVDGLVGPKTTAALQSAGKPAPKKPVPPGHVDQKTPAPGHKKPAGWGKPPPGMHSAAPAGEDRGWFAYARIGSESDEMRGGRWLHNWVPLDAEALKEKHHGHVPAGAKVGMTKHGTGMPDTPAGHMWVWDVGTGKPRLVTKAEAAAGHQRYGKATFRPGSPAAAEVEKKALALAREAAAKKRSADPDGNDRAGGATAHPAATEKLHEYWVHGEGAAKIKWGTPGDFDRCVRHLDKYMPGRAQGYCNLAHKAATGMYPAAHAKMEGKMSHFAPEVDVVRSGGGMKLEQSGDGTLGTLTGRFSEFGRWYKVSSKMEGDFLERVAPGATADTITSDRAAMRVLFDHGTDRQIGNKVLGPIDVLEEKDDGPHYEVPLFDTSYNRDLLPGLKAGVYGASMRMRVTGDAWDDRPARSDANPDGLPERTITRMKVLEFGPVTFPANPGASAGVRSGTDEFYGRLREVNAPAFADALRACGISPEDFTGRDGARSAPGGDEQDDVQPGNGGTSPAPNLKAAQRDREWRMRGHPSA